MKTILSSPRHSQSPARRKSVRSLLLRLLPALPLIVAGCLPVALSPFYRTADLITDPALLGHWKEKPEAAAGWAFTPGKNLSYDLVVTDDNGSSPFVAHLFTIDGHRFLDLFPGDKGLEDAKLSSIYAFSLVPGHICLRVKQTGPALQLQVFDYEWLQKHLKEHPAAIDHRYVGEGNDARLVFTGSTELMQRFIRQQLDTPDAWADLDALQKVPQASDAPAPR